MKKGIKKAQSSEPSGLTNLSFSPVLVVVCFLGTKLWTFHVFVDPINVKRDSGEFRVELARLAAFTAGARGSYEDVTSLYLVGEGTSGVALKGVFELNWNDADRPDMLPYDPH